MRQMLETTANAKLNLALRVTGRRMDGYHFLDSFISFCKFGDTVKISLSSTSDQVTMTGPFAPAITGPNIVEVARDQFRDITGWKQALHIHIIKHIPVSGGLGGGSADAAAVLRLLNQLWPGPPLSHNTMKTLAITIGADVAVCLLNKASRVRGIGEEINTVKHIPNIPVLLVNPRAKVSSKQVFENFLGPYSKPFQSLEESWTHEALFAFLGPQTTNDLTFTTLKFAPSISNILSFLKDIPEVKSCGMSGSGATCFALFNEEAESSIAEAENILNLKGWWTTQTTFVQ